MLLQAEKRSPSEIRWGFFVAGMNFSRFDSASSSSAFQNSPAKQR
jgi:hypothetical protein